MAFDLMDIDIPKTNKVNKQCSSVAKVIRLPKHLHEFSSLYRAKRIDIPYHDRPTKKCIIFHLLKEGIKESLSCDFEAIKDFKNESQIQIDVPYQEFISVDVAFAQNKLKTSFTLTSEKTYLALIEHGYNFLLKKHSNNGSVKRICKE